MKVDVLQPVSRIDVDLEFAKIKSIVDQSDSWVAATALEVYGWRAPRSGVDELEEYLEDESSDVAEAAWQATLDILARHDPDEAIDWLRKPTPLRQSNVTRLMAPVWSSASNESVRLLLEDERPVIRRKAFEVVKGELAENDIRKFTDDEDVSMRAAAYNELIRRGVRVDEQELEEKLKGLDARIPYSPGSTREDHSSPPTYARDDVFLEHYKALPYENLEQGIAWISARGPVRYEALADAYFEESKETLRNDISQNFQRLKDQFYREREALVSNASGGARDELRKRLIDEYKDLDDFMFERFRRAAYRVLAKHAEPSDTQFARSLLRNLRSDYYREELAQAAVEILTKHGDTNDVEPLKASISHAYPEARTDGAELILQLDPSHRSENIQYLVEMDDRHVIRGVLRYSLASSDGLLLDEAYNLLFSAKEQVRLDTLAYLAHECSRENLETLLDEYPNTQNFYYYNVLSWLDRLLYAPEDLCDVYAAELKQRLIGTGTQST